MSIMYWFLCPEVTLPSMPNTDVYETNFSYNPLAFVVGVHLFCRKRQNRTNTQSIKNGCVALQAQAKAYTDIRCPREKIASVDCRDSRGAVDGIKSLCVWSQESRNPLLGGIATWGRWGNLEAALGGKSTAWRGNRTLSYSLAKSHVTTTPAP